MTDFTERGRRLCWFLRWRLRCKGFGKAVTEDITDNTLGYGQILTGVLRAHEEARTPATTPLHTHPYPCIPERPLYGRVSGTQSLGSPNLVSGAPGSSISWAEPARSWSLHCAEKLLSQDQLLFPGWLEEMHVMPSHPGCLSYSWRAGAAGEPMDPRLTST